MRTTKVCGCEFLNDPFIPNLVVCTANTFDFNHFNSDIMCISPIFLHSFHPTLSLQSEQAFLALHQLIYTDLLFLQRLHQFSVLLRVPEVPSGLLPFGACCVCKNSTSFLRQPDSSNNMLSGKAYALADYVTVFVFNPVDKLLC